MGDDLLKLSKIGDFARDIRNENYKGGCWTDFSTSRTWPHVMLSPKGYVTRSVEYKTII